MIENIKKSLHQSLLQAILYYDDTLNEEQGGFIIKASKVEKYEFIPIRNANTGTPKALILYTADVDEFNEKIGLGVLDNLYSVFASFHTHPKGMRALPSHTDFNELFTSFPINYIYAPDKELNRFDYKGKSIEYPGNILWTKTNIMTFNGFNSNE